MRHVFFVHSHITYLVSEAVVRELRLRHTDVLIVPTRGYVPPNATFARLPFPDRRWVLTWRIDHWRRLRRELSRFLHGVAAAGEFVWYLPHTGFPFFRDFVGHPLCRGFHLIEEGMAAYYTEQEIAAAAQRVLTSKHGWRRWAARLLLAVRPPVFADPRYIMAYGCSDASFPGYARRQRIGIEGALPAGSGDIRAVLVFDALLESQLVSEDAFFLCLDELLQRIGAARHPHVHYKLHPQQYIDSRFTPRLKRVLQENRHGLRFTELPAAYCLELLACAGQAEFYVFTSSVGIYAADRGCRVFSMSGRLGDLDANYKRVADGIPERVRRKFMQL